MFAVFTIPQRHATWDVILYWTLCSEQCIGLDCLHTLLFSHFRETRLEIHIYPYRKDRENGREWTEGAKD